MESSQLSCDARFTESIKLAQSVDAERINCGVMTAAEFCSVREEPVRVGRAWRSVVSAGHFGGTILSSAGLDLRPSEEATHATWAVFSSVAGSAR